MERIREGLRNRASELGFALVGVTRPERSEHMAFYRSWLEAGHHGDMDYLAGTDAVRRRGDLSATMPGVASVIVVAHEYFQDDPASLPGDPSLGVVARYARGRDYHRVVKKKLGRLLGWLDEAVEGGVRGRAYVDTGPILERDLAHRAGLGWFGRNTMLIHPTRGSYFFLGVLLVDVHLPADEPFEVDRCGTCRACLDACPTGALLGRDRNGAPTMDARRCISYLTIEHRGPIPLELRPLMGNRVYGCDICQEVCPFNVRFAEQAAEPGYAARGPGERPSGVEPLPGDRAVEAGGAGSTDGGRAAGESATQTRSDVHAGTSRAGHPVHPGTEAPPLLELMRMSREDWDAFTRGSAIRRAGYAGFKRNVAVALGNWLASLPEPPEGAVSVLRKALEDESDLVRDHAAWALGQAGLAPPDSEP